MDLFKFDEFEKNNQNINPQLKLNLNCFTKIIGTDEAGRGPAAGGVWAAAVCFFDNVDFSLFAELNDSKKLNSKTREELYDTIIHNSFYSIKSVPVEIIEKINILNSSLFAMKSAVEEVMNLIKCDTVLTLVDGNRFIKDFNYPQKTVIKGDSKSASIAAASILAKVSRDRYMDKIDKQFPCYDWKKNKGYLTKKHINAILNFGITEYHRKSFLGNILNNSK